MSLILHYFRMPIQGEKVFIVALCLMFQSGDGKDLEKALSTVKNVLLTIFIHQSKTKT